MLLSIITPTYNSSYYISGAITGLLRQQDIEFEVLFIDNLSTDGTSETIKKYAAKHNHIRIISGHDKGIYDAMNTGIESAMGEWLYFMGCDDEFNDEHVLSVVARYLTSESDIVYGDVVWMPDNLIESGSCEPSQLINRNINHQRIFYRRSLFAQYCNYDLQYQIGADHELNIRFFCNNAVRKTYVPVLIARYHSGGFSANKLDEVFWSNWKKIFKENFAQHLPLRMMYDKLGWYCRYLIDKQKYKKALPLFFDVLLHTWSPGFVLLTFRQLFKPKDGH